MLRKKTNGVARRPQRTSILSEAANASVDRRAFLRGSGLAIGGLAAVAATGGTVTQANAASAATGAVELKKSVCTHCSVGCSVMAEIEDGTWVGQEPGWDSPFNLGARPPALAVDHLLVGQNGHIDRVPVHHRVFAVNQPLFHEVDEHRLLLAVIFRVRGRKLAAPIQRPAQRLHLRLHLGNVAIGIIAWMST